MGPRQVGKTTLAMQIASERPSVYLDLERPADRAKLDDAETFLLGHQDKLVVLDEIHRVPELFASLRGIIDQGRRDGKGIGRFLVLGSASLDLLKQSSESLAGRIAYVEMPGVQPTEIAGKPTLLQSLWIRGGFPDSLLANTDEASMVWRQEFIRTYLEREIPLFGPRVPAETMRRLWTMLAHNQGALLRSTQLAESLGVSAPTVTRYIDLLVDLLLVRRLQPHHVNVGKRLTKSPKTFIRDSGVLHALLGITTFDDLAGHPVLGASWEGFVIEALIAAAPQSATASFYRSSAGAEIDVLLTLNARETWAVEIKSGLVPKVERGFHQARKDTSPTRSFVVYGGSERFPMSEGVEAVGLTELARELQALRTQ